MKYYVKTLSRRLTDALDFKLILSLSLILFAQAAICQSELSFTTKVIAPEEYNSAIAFGVSLVDFNLDGFDDLTVTNYSSNDLTYLNNGSSFSSILNAIALKNYTSSGLTWGDIDNDSYPDLFVSTQGPSNHLFKNNINGFTELFDGEHIQEQLISSHASWVDFNNDGWLDLFIANTESYGTSAGKENSLFISNNGKEFTRVKEGDIVTDKQNSMCGNWADIDNDGDQDLLSLNMGSDNALYINNGDGTFRKSTDSVITQNALFSISCSWIDVNNDGYLDAYIGNGGFRKDTNYLLINNGDATFRHTTEGDIVRLKLETWNSLWGDLDNDGDLDMIELPLYSNNILHINNGDGSFTSSELQPSVQKMASGAISDLDNDGDLDVFFSDAYGEVGNTFYYNDGNENNWFQVNFKGITGSGIGARVKIKANINGNSYWQIREISGNNAFRSQNSMRQHFGVGDADRIDSLVFYLPSKNLEIIKTDLDVNQLYTINEPLPEGFLLARFCADSTEGVASCAVNFSDYSIANISTPITSWKWDFDNDGIVDSEEQNPSYTFTATEEDKKFTVKLTIVSDAGEHSYLIEDCITVYKSDFENLARQQGVDYYSSSNENNLLVAQNAFDGSLATRWASKFKDPQWIMADFNKEVTIGGFQLDWENAYAEEFKIYTSSDSINWTERYSTIEGKGGVQKISFEPISARYVMLYGTKRATPYGYSLYEFGIYDRMPFGEFSESGETIIFTSAHTNKTDGLHLKLYPNPVKDILNIEYTLEKKSNVKLDLYDNKGALVANLINEKYNAGSHLISCPVTGNLTKGIYYYSFKNNEYSTSGYFIKE